MTSLAAKKGLIGHQLVTLDLDSLCNYFTLWKRELPAQSFSLFLSIHTHIENTETETYQENNTSNNLNNNNKKIVLIAIQLMGKQHPCYDCSLW